MKLVAPSKQKQPYNLSYFNIRAEIYPELTAAEKMNTQCITPDEWKCNVQQ